MDINSQAPQQLSTSFRDPSGFLFHQQGVLYRQINEVYEPDYNMLKQSGLLAELTSAGLLVDHAEVDVLPPLPAIASRVIQPEVIEFISYPYEWSFSQLKAAALLTLDIASRAFAHGMSLKDSSAYNVQFHNSQAIFIDTLSFESYRDGQPWVAYQQFCQHFLAPLALMSLTDIHLSQLLRTNIDGVPLKLASSMLPFRSRLKFTLLTHIHLHAKAQEKYSKGTQKQHKSTITKHQFRALLDNLRTAVEGLRWHPGGTEWVDYYSGTNYSDEAMSHKHELVRAYLKRSNPRCVWDLGANTGAFSRIAAEFASTTISFDIDPAAVEKNFLACQADEVAGLLPLLLDLANPSPSIGWHHRERMSILERGPADTAMALALIHHLAISNNLPFAHVAAFLAEACNWLIIEFVPKSDSQVQRLLANREDIFCNYDQQQFELAFEQHFEIVESKRVRSSERTLYLMRCIESETR